ncbi:MAG: DNA-processing protein DprA [candidate division Zixibacteria bacterium]|nr:DNA-processing protein DprA [candidate division Zixibacteria bacterium]MBU1471260.1 DNA-processing protein DprA [candidate division Zixibacteria bacterium]MBU2625128.1 DNA-processing protein DprA [candidate division Zixibacteria bacterium]
MMHGTAYLQLMLAYGIGPKGIMRLLGRLQREDRSIEDFIDAPVSELTTDYGLGSDTAASIGEMRQESELIAQELESNQIHTLVRGLEGYPIRLEHVLGQDAPPIIFAAGNLNIMELKSVGICGGRKATDRGCEVARKCAEVFSRADVNIVSGNAPGVDISAHYGALAAGGTTTFVLATGILHFTARSGFEDVIGDDNYLVMSEFSPRTGWHAHNAMQRNKTVCGMSNAIILVEPALKGGTFAAGTAALQLQRPLFVVDYDDARSIAKGNMYFIDRGARTLDSDRIGSEELAIVVSSLDTKLDRPVQSSLFDSLDSNDPQT